MASGKAAGARAQWSVDECAEFAARQQFKYVAMLSLAEASVVSMLGWPNISLFTQI